MPSPSFPLEMEASVPLVDTQRKSAAQEDKSLDDKSIQKPLS